jgi:hypothetical protein
MPTSPPPPGPEAGASSSVRSFANRALSMPMCALVALLFCVLLISSSTSLIFSRMPMVPGDQYQDLSVVSNAASVLLRALQV